MFIKRSPTLRIAIPRMPKRELNEIPSKTSMSAKWKKRFPVSRVNPFSAEIEPSFSKTLKRFDLNQSRAFSTHHLGQTRRCGAPCDPDSLVWQEARLVLNENAQLFVEVRSQ